MQLGICSRRCGWTVWKNKRKAKGRAQESGALSRGGRRGVREEPGEDWQSAEDDQEREVLGTSGGRNFKKGKWSAVQRQQKNQIS